jgi:lysophospholipase L1-like esterase
VSTHRSTVVGRTAQHAFGPQTPTSPRATDHNNQRLLFCTFDTALADRANSPIDVVFVGDSITTGAGASTLDKRWLSLVRDRLRASFQPSGVAGGLGYVQADTTYNSPWTLTGVSAWTSAGGLGEGARSLPVGATAALTFTGTSVDIFYGKTVGGGTLTVQIDGASSGTGFAAINTANASQVDSAVQRVAATGPGTHTLLITSSVAASVLEGAMIYNGDETKGIRTWDGGRTGIPTSDYVSNPRYLSAITAIQPALVTVFLGTNNYRIPKPVSLYASDLVSMMKSIRAACTTPPSILLVMPYLPDPGSATLAFTQFYSAVYQAASIIGDVEVLDLYNKFGTDIQTNTRGLLSGDKVHPSDKGHQLIADSVLDLILPNHAPLTLSTYAQASNWDALANGVESVRRKEAANNSGTVSGQAEYGFCVPLQDTTITKLLHCTRSTAGAGITLARMGLYTVDAAGNLTLVARTVDFHGTGAIAANTLFQQSLDATGGYPTSYTMKAGQKYAIGFVYVGTTPPTVVSNNSGQPGALAALQPFICANQTGQADLPTSVSVGSLTGHFNMYWVAALA